MEQEQLFWNAYEIFKKHWFSEQSIFQCKKLLNCRIKHKCKVTNIINNEVFFQFYDITKKHFILKSNNNNLFYFNKCSNILEKYGKCYPTVCDVKYNRCINKRNVFFWDTHNLYDQHTNKILKNNVNFNSVYFMDSHKKIIEFNFENNILKMIYNDKTYYSYIEENFKIIKYDNQFVYFGNGIDMILFTIQRQKIYCYNCCDIIPHKSSMYILRENECVIKSKIWFDEYSEKNILYPANQFPCFFSQCNQKIIFVNKISKFMYITINENGEIFTWHKNKKNIYKLMNKTQFIYENEFVQNIEYIEYIDHTYVIVTKEKKIYLSFFISKCKYNMCIDNLYGLYVSKPSYVFQKIHEKIYLYYQNNQLLFLTNKKINSKTIFVDNNIYYIIDTIDNVSYVNLMCKSLYLGFEDGQFSVISSLINIQ